MTPSTRTMPIVEAHWSPMDRKWLIHLPGNLTMPARDEAAVEWLVDRLAPGSSIRYVRVFRGEPVAVRRSPPRRSGLSAERST